MRNFSLRLLLVIFLITSIKAAAVEKSSAEIAYLSVQKLCMLPLKANKSVIENLRALKVPEHKDPKAIDAFLKGRQDPALFILSNYVMLGASDSEKLCQIYIAEMDVDEFWKQDQFWFNGDGAPYRITKEEEINGEKLKEYIVGPDGDSLYLIIRSRNEKSDDNLKGLITVGRMK